MPGALIVEVAGRADDQPVERRDRGAQHLVTGRVAQVERTDHHRTPGADHRASQHRARTRTRAPHGGRSRPQSAAPAPAPAQTCGHHATIDSGSADCGWNDGITNPQGSAQCKDGSWSPATGSGACSYHKGVLHWFV